MPKLLGLGPEFHPENGLQPRFSGRRANRAIELRRTQPMEESTVHRPTIERTKRAAVGVRQNRLAAKLRRNRTEARCDLVESLIPGNSLTNLRLVSCRMS